MSGTGRAFAEQCAWPDCRPPSCTQAAGSCAPAACCLRHRGPCPPSRANSNQLQTHQHRVQVFPRHERVGAGVDLLANVLHVPHNGRLGRLKDLGHRVRDLGADAWRGRGARAGHRGGRRDGHSERAWHRGRVCRVAASATSWRRRRGDDASGGGSPGSRCRIGCPGCLHKLPIGALPGGLRRHPCRPLRSSAPVSGGGGGGGESTLAT